MPCHTATRRRYPRSLALLLVSLASGWAAAQTEDPLPAYLAREDRSFKWRKMQTRHVQGCEVSRLECVSQKWRENTWTHEILVVRPPELRNPDVVLMLIHGSGDVERSLNVLQKLALAAGAVTAVISDVPNQPLYEGRSEDALIAYTFDQYLRTGDSTWPLLFPMVKSAVKGMDAVQAHARTEWKLNIERFVVTGVSKRGWTTWLTAAVDPRVKAIAPIVIDMLNIKAQTWWAERMYGGQSERLRDYTEYNLPERIDDPDVTRLMSWVDPYSYRSRYKMPKLLLLGTNDPFWVVDSLRHYWSQLPEPKLVYQTPNAGHNLMRGENAQSVLAAFFQMVADHEPLPGMTWTISAPRSGTNSATIDVKVRPKAKRFALWTADSLDRDFRDAQWSASDLKTEDDAKAHARVDTPAQGFRAFMVEAELVTRRGLPYKLSTEARVTPDGRPKRPSPVVNSD